MSTSKPRPDRGFKEACQHLLKRIRQRGASDGDLAGLALPPFDPDIGIAAQVTELEKALDAFLSSRKEFLEGKSRDRKEKFKSIAVKWYCNSYPFAVTILSVAKEGAAVRPSSLRKTKNGRFQFSVLLGLFAPGFWFWQRCIFNLSQG